MIIVRLKETRALDRHAWYFMNGSRDYFRRELLIFCFRIFILDLLLSEVARVIRTSFRVNINLPAHMETHTHKHTYMKYTHTEHQSNYYIVVYMRIYYAIYGCNQSKTVSAVRFPGGVKNVNYEDMHEVYSKIQITCGQRTAKRNNEQINRCGCGTTKLFPAGNRLARFFELSYRTSATFHNISCGGRGRGAVPSH